LNTERECDYEEEISRCWLEVSEIIHTLFGLDAAQIPREIESVSSTELLDGISQIQNGKLLISEKVALGDIPLQAVVARECLKSALPKKGICIKWAEDLANEFARQYLTGKNREDWYRTWIESTQETKVNDALSHSPQRAYALLYEAMGERALQNIVSDFINASKYGTEMSLEDYLQYFYTVTSRFTVPLDTTELHIIDSLIKDPNATPKTQAKKLSLSPQWISTKITELQRKMILRKFETVRFSKIGIRMFHLEIGNVSISEILNQYLSGCPFLYGIRSILSGPNQALAILAVPDNPINIAALDRFIKGLQDDMIEHRLFEVTSSSANYCFDYYDSEDGIWRIPWDLERVQLSKIHQDDLASIFPKIDEKKCMDNSEFDMLDMRILGTVWRGATSVYSIRKELRVGQERVAAKLKEFRNQDIITMKWEIHNIGLIENIMIHTEDASIGASIAAWSQRLPRTIHSFDDERRMVLMCSLPQGGTYGMIWAMELLATPIQTSVLGQSLYGYWRFPDAQWDVNTCQWKASYDEIESWLGSIP